jgi:CBS domain-containing protein
MRIKDVVKDKASQRVVTISPEASVRDLVELLGEHNIGAVVVSSDGASVEGIASERDVVRQLRQGSAVLDVSVASIMTSTVHTCTMDDDLDELMSAMTDRRIRHVPVVDDGRLTGVVSIGDVVKARITRLEFERDQLDSYVHQT